MEKLLQLHQDSHIFCDETPIGGHNGISLEFLMDLSKNISSESFFWLACNSKWPDREHLETGKLQIHCKFIKMPFSINIAC